MKTRGLIDLYLPKKVAFHVKFLLFSLIMTTIFVGFKNLINEKFIQIFSLIFVQMEVFFKIGTHLETIFIFFAKRVRIFKQEETRAEITKQMIVAWILFYILAVLSALIIFIIFLYVVYLMHGWDLSQVISNFIHVEFRGWFKATNIGMGVGTLMYVYIIWQDALKKIQKLKEEKLIFKYETLKNQVNPHFLFNSLNTLSSLVSTNPDLAETFIQKLSSIYRFILEFKETELIDLEMELKFVKDYFYLQQIRDEDKIKLEIKMEDTKYKILPISLQILVENALKHNSATTERPLIISIIQHSDVVEVRNNLQKRTTFQKSTGTGLTNLKERVRYNSKKEIKVEETNQEFIVTIPIIPDYESSDR